MHKSWRPVRAGSLKAGNSVTAAEADAAIASTAANGDNIAGVSRDTSSSHQERKAGDSRAAGPYRVTSKKELAVAAPEPMQLSDQPSDRRGWTSVSTEGRLHLIGWIQPSSSDVVRGVELEMAGLIGRLGGALPAEVLEDEGYALRDEQGRVIHQIGRVRQSGEALVSVPLSNELLPGWSVAAFLLPSIGESIDGTSFFWTSAVLVALFVAAILAGGSLLLRQARRSELEALQKTSFVANFSHEFKTPLTTIRL